MSAFTSKNDKDKGINPSSIAVSRELRRNAERTFNGLYSSRRAETLARKRRRKTSAHNASVQLSTEMKNFVRQEPTLHTLPEIISGKLQELFDITVSKKTLYRYIRRDRLTGYELYLQLPHRGNPAQPHP